MASFSHTARPSARGFFIVTPYDSADDGTYHCHIPGYCPLKRLGDPPCKVTEHHRRYRKTGPGFPLLVIRCGTHRKHFTLYPPGYAPYRRQPVVDQAPDGTEPLGPRNTPLHAFQGTLFDAALDAGDRKPWARDSATENPLPEQWWSTQGRHLDLALRMLGLLKGMKESVREAIAAVLSLDLLVLLELAQKVATTPGYRAKGKAVSEVLGAVAPRRDRGHRLLHCGYLIGHWAFPLCWNKARQVLDRLPFEFQALEPHVPP